MRKHTGGLSRSAVILAILNLTVTLLVTAEAEAPNSACPDAENRVKIVESMMETHKTMLLQNHDYVNQCLQLRDNNTRNNGDLELARCDTFGRTQVMTFHQLNGSISIPFSGKCLTVYQATALNGPSIIVNQYDCVSAVNQDWKYNYTQEYPGWFQIISVSSNKCLDFNGTNLVINPCAPLLFSQYWAELPIQPAIGQIVNYRQNTLCLSPGGNSTFDFVPMNLTVCDPHALFQQFEFSMGTNYWLGQTIQNSLGKSVTLSRGMQVNGARVQQLIGLDIDRQFWQVVNGDFNTAFQLQNPTNKRCLTAEASGTYIDIWDCINNITTTGHQFWTVKMPEYVAGNLQNVGNRNYCLSNNTYTTGMSLLKSVVCNSTDTQIFKFDGKMINYRQVEGQIQHNSTSLCLTADVNNSLSPCVNSNIQKWSIVGSLMVGIAQIMNPDSQTCLGLNSSTWNVEIGNCVANVNVDASQFWKFYKK